MRRAEVVADLVRGDQAVEHGVVEPAALAEADAEAGAAEHLAAGPSDAAGVGDADRRAGAAGALDIPAGPEMGEAVHVLVRLALAIVGQLDEKFARDHCVGERVRSGTRIGKYLHQRHVDLDADLVAEDAVDVVEALEYCLLRSRAVDAGEFSVPHRTDIDFRFGPWGQRGFRTKFRRQRLVDVSAIRQALARAAGHRSGRDVRVREPVDDRRVRARDVVAGPLDREQLVAVPDQPGWNAVRHDDTDPGVLIARQFPAVRCHRVARDALGCIEQAAVRRQQQFEAAPQRIETDIDGARRGDLLTVFHAGALDAQALQRLVMRQRNRGCLQARRHDK